MASPFEISGQHTNHFHSEALAYDLWARKYGAWIVLGFTTIFALFLIGMDLVGQEPGKSFFLKSASDIIQFIGEGIGCFFCVRIARRLRWVYLGLRHELIAKEVGQQASSDLPADRARTHEAYRAYLAWLLLAIAIALYTSGQLVWTSYDIRLNPADVPFPGLYDIGFVAAYAFFLVGTLLLTRRSKAAVRRTYLLLDALAIIGTALALSWFFLLSPSIAKLPHAPSAGAAFLSLYFPTGDLFLVAVGAFLMFSPLSSREQQPVFLLLCSGLFFLAVSDSLLSFYNFSGGFNTGTIQDVLWPASMQLIGLAAIEYPHSITYEQEQPIGPADSATPAPLVPAASRGSQLVAVALTILPLILVLTTCALLLLRITPLGGMVALQSDFVVLALVLILIARQTLTLLENNRLVSQIQNELTLSQRELRRKRQEIDEANRRAQEKLELDEGVAALRSVHTRIARGDLTARVPAIAGPLQQIAVSLNMMLDQLHIHLQQGAYYRHIAEELKMVQAGVERFEQGLPPWSANQLPAQCSPELRTIFHGLAHIYAHQAKQWSALGSSLEAVHKLAQHLRETLSKIAHTNLFTSSGQSETERMVIEMAIREAEVLEQQQQYVLDQANQAMPRSGSPGAQTGRLWETSRRSWE